VLVMGKEMELRRDEGSFRDNPLAAEVLPFRKVYELMAGPASLDSGTHATRWLLTTW